MFLFNKIREKGRTGSAWKRRVRGSGKKVAKTMYTHVSKCKNDKLKKEKKDKRNHYVVLC
jgi:hypothetical protein